MTPSTNAAARRATAYSLLGVSPNVVAAAPRITHLIRKIKGGWPSALEALRASDSREARSFMIRYDDLYLPSYVRKVLPIEAFAVAADLSPTRLFAVIAECIRTQKQQLGAIKAAQAHEEIVEVSSQAALDADRVEDRMAHLKHMAFLPAAKGAQISIVNQASATASADAKSLAVSAESPEATIRRMVEARQRNAQLAAGQQAALPPASESVPAFMPQPTAQAEYVDGDYAEADD
jgi:hypothetical protein